MTRGRETVTLEFVGRRRKAVVAIAVAQARVFGFRVWGQSVARRCGLRAKRDQCPDEGPAAWLVRSPLSVPLIVFIKSSILGVRYESTPAFKDARSERMSAMTKIACQVGAGRPSAALKVDVASVAETVKKMLNGVIHPYLLSTTRVCWMRAKRSLSSSVTIISFIVFV